MLQLGLSDDLCSSEVHPAQSPHLSGPRTTGHSDFVLLKNTIRTNEPSISLSPHHPHGPAESWLQRCTKARSGESVMSSSGHGRKPNCSWPCSVRSSRSVRLTKETSALSCAPPNFVHGERKHAKNNRLLVTFHRDIQTVSVHFS